MDGGNKRVSRCVKALGMGRIMSDELRGMK